MNFVIGIIAYTLALSCVVFVLTREVFGPKDYNKGYRQGQLDGMRTLGKTLEDELDEHVRNTREEGEPSENEG